MNNLTQQTEQEEDIDLLKYWFLFLRNWYWLLFGLVLGLSASFFYIRYATPMYAVSGKVMLNEKEESSVSVLEQLGLKESANAENDLAVLKSSLLMRRVVDTLGLAYCLQNQRTH
jgi:tyrosine-protein kinase Etk/Wzc